MAPLRKRGPPKTLKYGTPELWEDSGCKFENTLSRVLDLGDSSLNVYFKILYEGILYNPVRYYTILQDRALPEQKHAEP